MDFSFIDEHSVSCTIVVQISGGRILLAGRQKKSILLQRQNTPPSDGSLKTINI